MSNYFTNNCLSFYSSKLSTYADVQHHGVLANCFEVAKLSTVYSVDLFISATVW